MTGVFPEFLLITILSISEKIIQYILLFDKHIKIIQHPVL